MKILIVMAFLLFGLVSASFLQPCATVTVTLASAQVSQGGTQVITSDVANCGDKKTRFGVTVSETDAVGHIFLLRNDFVNLNPGESVSLQDTYVVAADAPLGTNRVMTIVFHSANGTSTEIARDQKTFEVVQ